MQPNYASTMSIISPFNPNPFEIPLDLQPLEIIAQPIQKSRLRYRSDYERNPIRRGVIRSENNPNHSRPTIRIPQAYLDFSKQYSIRVSLVTIINEETNCRYHHPYDLEDVDRVKLIDESNNTVMFPIGPNDRDGIKSFQNLRIVKKRADELRELGDLKVFDSLNSSTTPQLSSSKETIRKFNLDRFHLAFTLGEELIINGISKVVFYARTTQFSDEMFDPSRKSHPVNSSSELTARGPAIPKSNVCEVYKYAPRYGYDDTNNEVLMFFTDKLLENRYGALQVTFEYDIAGIPWSEPVLDLEVKDQMVSFRTPTFPYTTDDHATVNVVLKQGRRKFELLQFNYISKVMCPQCQRNPIVNQNPNKRSISAVYNDPINRSEDNPEEEASGFSELLSSDTSIFK